MLVSHRESKSLPWSWQNFPRSEVSCPCCGEFFYDPDAMDKIQAARDYLGLPIKINSGHRCAIHNALVGGAPLSQHLKLAFDVSLVGHDRFDALVACQKAGFTGLGYYRSFLHVDTGRKRFWYGRGAKELWTS